jgi:hypothetical protein
MTSTGRRDLQVSIIISYSGKLLYPVRWYDALCIIQDSKSDWEHKSPLMNQVYANTRLTVVATKTSSAHVGFLLRRHRQISTARIPYNGPDADDADGYFHLEPKYLHFALSDQDAHIEDSVWNTRGWASQERLMSPRLLHFTKEMLYFECYPEDWMEDNRPQGSSVNHLGWLGTNTTDTRRKLWVGAGRNPDDDEFVSESKVVGFFKAPSWSWVHWDSSITYAGVYY